jgi:hypothetical protein
VIVEFIVSALKRTLQISGMKCVRCSNELIAPEWSEYWNERHIRHHWGCSRCDCCFETIADTNSIKAM